MTHIADLAATSYWAISGNIRAVGYLEYPHEYSRGEVDPKFFRKLMELIARPNGLLFCLGMHRCGFCASEGKDGPDARTSQATLLIPSDDCLYESPIWIGHYIHAHSYRPPDEFIRAVESCPQPGSDAFRKLLAAHVNGLSYLEEQCNYVDWSDGAKRTLLPDQEYGSYEKSIGRRESRKPDPFDPFVEL